MDNPGLILSTEDKFAKALLDLRTVVPFYSAVWESIKHIENNSIETMCVDASALYYNSDFVDKLEYSDFLFACLHELVHIALMHVARSYDKDLEVWNEAADLYTNSLIKNDLINSGYNYNITMPSFCLYDANVDVNKDCVEDLYERLLNDKSSNGGNNPYNNESGTGNGNGGGNNNSNNGNGNCGNSNRNSTLCNDIIRNSSKEKSDSDSRNVISQAVVKSQLKSSGSGTSLLEVKAKELIKSRIDWKKYLSKYCIQTLSKDSSFSIPDKRMYYQNAIYPGQSLENSQLDGIKICIDCSGSVSDEELGVFYGHVAGILNKYKMNAEVLFWDVKVNSTKQFSSLDSFLSVSPKGRGGTDVNCIFDYFDSSECKSKPKLILVFTDGYFFVKTNTKHKKKYSKTLWIMSNDYNKNLDVPFGKIVLNK